MDKHADIPQTAATRERARRTKAKAAAQDWRKRAAAEGRPIARNVDAAIAEGVAFLVVKAGETIVSLAELVEIATLILQRDGHDRVLSKKLVAQQLRPRLDHSLIGFIPNLGGVDDLARIHPPASGRTWSQRDADRLNAIVEHTPNAGNGRAPSLPPHTRYTGGEDR